MSVEKGTAELSGFNELVAESSTAGPMASGIHSCLSGRNGESPSAGQVAKALRTMVERVRGGMIDGLLALDPSSPCVSDKTAAWRMNFVLSLGHEV